MAVVEAALGSSVVPRSIGLAAAFDLIVASRFYESVTLENWLWCEDAGLDIYAFLNACPWCSTRGTFVTTEGNKPQSGSIGPITASTLRQVLASYFALTGRERLLVTGGAEPIDLAVLDESHKSVFLAEVKAAPLFTPPLAVLHQPDRFNVRNGLPLRHHFGTLRRIDTLRLGMYVPQRGDASHVWWLEDLGATEPGWSERALLNAVRKNPAEFEAYLQLWAELWRLYGSRNRDAGDALFWLTGACGLPAGPGEGWRRDAAGRAVGSISDSKTSVGMDRTDDIKKSTFQVLNMGVKFRRVVPSGWHLAIGMASNLHAARHHGDYLTQYEDIVWAWAKQNEEVSSYYNLFDGIVTFTADHTRDSWIRTWLDWL